MSEEKESEKKLSQDGSRSISRREFAIGSIAFISSYSAAEESDKKPTADIKLEISDAIRNLLEERHILDEDMIRVIQNAEKTGEKLYEPETGRFLSKLRSNKTWFYVEYSKIEGGYRIHSAYSHRVTFADQ
jgi:hypothetical protein